MHRLSRPTLILAALAILAGCAARNQELEPPQDLGDFRLGYNIVVSENAETVPPSKRATPEEWKAVLTEAIDKRFRRYEGDRLYHLGVNVDGYSLAIPGIPVIAAPKSILVISANIWDDAAGKKLNTEARQITLWETLSGEMLFGSGMTMTRDQQMRDLAASAARQIENWLAENREAWLVHDSPAGGAGGDTDAAAGPGAAPGVGAADAPLIAPAAPPAPVN